MSTRVPYRTTIGRLAIGAAFSVIALLADRQAAGGERQFLVILATSPKEYNLPCNTDWDDEDAPYDTWCPNRPYEYVCTVVATFDRHPQGICRTLCSDDNDCEDVSEAEGTTFVCNYLWEAAGRCVPRYPAPELIRKQYFDRTNNSIGSFAEYWEEISYGDVTISGQVTDWINLPWRINPPILPPGSDADFPEGIPVGLSGDPVFEPFDTFRAMVPVDIDGDPNGVDNGPLTSAQNPTYARGGRDVNLRTGLPIWMPGERFIDMDDDGRWDGLDEATNSMDWNGDNQPDLDGPWYDLNQNGEADNPNNCVYLRDGDNDGNPDCCPDGPGELGCEPFPDDGACRATRWEGPGGSDITDCNGNTIPDVCDVGPEERQPSAACRATGWLTVDPTCEHCGQSGDSLPWVPNSTGTGCGPVAGDPPGSVNGITRDDVPDECQFINASTPCRDSGTEEEQCPNVGSVCVPDEDTRRTIVRCEYHDWNDNDELDIVEPFENFLVYWNGFTWVRVPDSYVRANYPGNPDRVLARSQTRTIYARHDPLGLIGGSGCRCADGTDCRNIFGLTNVCPAGQHAQYDPPDFWLDGGSNKLQANGIAGMSLEPPWYKQWWRDRYGTTPPPWNRWIPRLLLFAPGATDENDDSRIVRRAFAADRGGTHGDGSGWIDCDDAVDRFVEFEVFGTGVSPFEDACNHRILPEEPDLGEPLILYDGPMDFDDLPSSKYHRYGDGRLGEITSPYTNDIWGEDLGNGTPGGSQRDGYITAAGPYATHVHGNLGYDAGNVLSLELLTALDWNLDGLFENGFSSRPGTENYRDWDWGSARLVEDSIAILDDVIDFDDYVDAVTLDHLGGGDAFATSIPPAYRTGDPAQDVISPSGICSGVVLLPPNVYTCARLGLLVDRCAFHNMAPALFPIHNEDGLNDPQYTDATFPKAAPALSWNIFFHDLVTGIDISSCSLTIPQGNYQTAYAAHKWLHTWENFADMYDYDVFQPGTIENCPVARWDIMADGGLVHPAPIMKERPGTRWAVPVDLRRVLTPGVDATLTLPPAEFHRDSGYYYLENEDRAGERYYLWSAGSGFDRQMPAAGMLIMHTDVTPRCQTSADCQSVPCVAGYCDGEVSNPDAPPAQQRTATRPTYLIVQADGEGELQACVDRGDAGDPWPGSTGATRFNYDTVPPATWYTQNSWTGLDVLNVVPDGAGSIQVTMNLVPTSVPSLRFVDPPGGESVGSTYQVRFNATDVYGGTTIRLYYIKDQKVCSDNGDPCAKDGDCPADEFCKYRTVIAAGEANFVGQRKKMTPGTNELSMNWNISSIPDGRYVFFAKLIPGAGADGSERRSTVPRAGRNNAGTGKLTVNHVNIEGNTARSETWAVACVDSQGLKWRVHSSLSQPVLNETDPDEDPYPRATTGQAYTSPGGEVRFTITASNECLTQGKGCFTLGDSFTFTTTGITAASRAVTIIGRQIKEDPTAVINASPLSGDPPLRVQFDGRNSYDPNGEPLQYLWNFGDGTATVSSAQTSHVFQTAGTFTTVLRVTNPRNSRFGEAAVDIEVTNNSPRAKISATPTSGPVPLQVDFSAAQSADTETPADRLVYQWDFGDGSTANNNLTPGSAFRTIMHLYSKKADGTSCTRTNPCTFIATLTVTDEGGKSDTETVTILVGNTHPKAVITHTALQGPHPWEVVFNAINSYDPDGDPLMVEWVWGDGSPNDIFPTTGATGATDGSVPHTYKLPSGQTGGSFSTLARVRDDRGGLATWGPVTVVVSEATIGSSDPRAIFTIDPAKPELGKSFTVNASLSYDRPAGGTIKSYTWAWGDQTVTSTGMTATHTYTQAGTYTITLTVADAENPPNKGTASKTVIISSDGGETPVEGENRPPTAAFTVNPTRGYAGATVFTFDASASSDPDGDDAKLSFRWSFGDGRTGTGRVATHVYEDASPDGYVVRLTVRDEKNASTSTSQEVTVEENVGNLPPKAHIATGPRTGTAPVTLSFDGRNSYDPNGDPLTFRWEFALNGEVKDVLMGALVSKRFDEDGTYGVELEVSDGRGGVGRAGPEMVTVSAPGEVPPDGGEDGGEGEPEPPHEIPNSANQRPLGVGFCGVGMIPALLGSLTGLAAMMVTRRRRMM